MKLSEVIAELENGSNKIYEAYAEDGERIQMSRGGRYLNFQKFSYEGEPHDPRSKSGSFAGNCELELDWSPIRTAVPWDVATREWAFGISKTIYCEIGGCRFTSDSKEFSITPRMIQFGVWYVEG